MMFEDVSGRMLTVWPGHDGNTKPGFEGAGRRCREGRGKMHLRTSSVYRKMGVPATTLVSLRAPSQSRHGTRPCTGPACSVLGALLHAGNRAPPPPGRISGEAICEKMLLADRAYGKW